MSQLFGEASASDDRSPVRRGAWAGLAFALATAGAVVSAPAPAQSQDIILDPLHLAVGVPSEDIGSVRNAGVVHIMRSDPVPWRSTIEQQLPLSKHSFTLQQGQRGMGDEPEAGDGFGSAVVFGDFDGDGSPDVAISAPREDIRGKRDVGVVHVLHGSDGVAGGGRAMVLHQGKKGVRGRLHAGDRFGHALAVADMDRDGFDDLAVGVPFEDVDGVPSAGIVQLFFGSPDGLTRFSRIYKQGSGGLSDAPEAGDRFGWTLAGWTGDAGQIDADTLVVGVPFEDIGSRRNAGAVQVISEMTPSAQAFYHQGLKRVDERPERNDRFGSSVALRRHFGNDTVTVLVGVPMEDLRSGANAGVVHEIVTRGGSDPFQNTTISQAYNVVPDRPEAGDRFGAAMACRSNCSWVGAPGEDLGGVPQAGLLHQLTGIVHHPGQSRFPGANGQDDEFGSSVAAARRLAAVVTGAPGRDVGAARGAGAIYLGISDPFGAVSWFRYEQGSAIVGGTAETGDRFGSVVASW